MDWRTWKTLLDGALEERERAGLLRERRAVTAIDATHLEWRGKRYVNFASNDYLGLSHHPKVIDAVRQAAGRYGVGSGAAGLISGYTEEHFRAEQKIATWKGYESAILMPSGYQANHAAVQTVAAVAEGGARFLLDKNVHASLIDAVRGTGMEMRVWPHNGLGKLERLLAEAPKDQVQVVLTESIFSMDGDAADLLGLAELKKRFEFLLILDEAHGTGVYGANGSGYAAEMGLAGIADISIVTLSKAIGCVGGVVCGTRTFIEAVTNFGRAWIYSTEVPAMIASAAAAAIEVMRDEPQRQERVRTLARRVREAIGIDGVFTNPADCPIVPVILGDEKRALQAAEMLGEMRMWVVAVRPPTVTRGSSRLRLTISAEHSDEEIAELITVLNRMVGSE